MAYHYHEQFRPSSGPPSRYQHSWQHSPPSAMLALRLRVHPATTTLRTLRYSTSSHFMPVHPPVPRPTDWKSAAPSPPAGSTTFAAQSTLLKLPVLPLALTLERLKDTLGPIAHSQAELADAQRKIDEFATGIGPELQRRLEEHAQYKPHWLENWWDDGAYLSYRDSVRRSSSLGLLCDYFVTDHLPQVMINVSYYC